MILNYFKLISGDKIIGVATSQNCRCFQQKHGVMLFCDLNDAQYLECNGVYYHDDWLRSIKGNPVDYQMVSIIVIEKDEYDALSQAFEIQEEITILTAEPELESDNPDEPNITLDFIKEMKIQEMSNICHKNIVAGVDVVLSDGISHHFSMELEDQLKVQALALKAERGGNTLLAWHPDNELCQFYSANDILAIFHALETLQTVQTTYFNSLKNYIKSINNIEEVSKVQYGMEIPAPYQSDVWKYILSLYS